MKVRVISKYYPKIKIQILIQVRVIKRSKLGLTQREVRFIFRYSRIIAKALKGYCAYSTKIRTSRDEPYPFKLGCKYAFLLFKTVCQYALSLLRDNVLANTEI